MTSTDGKGRLILVVAAQRSDAGRFNVRADQELPAFLELESAIQAHGHDHECDCRNRIKNWEVIADNLSKAGWSWGCVSAVDLNGRTIWIADAHRSDGQRFIVQADEKLTAFLELESAIRRSPSFTCPCTTKRHSAGTETYD